MPTIDIRRVRYFLALSETLSFSNAAKMLCLSQPALTKATQRLDEDLSGALVRREGRNTQLGRSVLELFRELKASRR